MNGEVYSETLERLGMRLGRHFDSPATFIAAKSIDGPATTVPSLWFLRRLNPGAPDLEGAIQDAAQYIVRICIQL